MNKTEYLRGCIASRPEEITFTWKALGENKITSSTKIYSKDMIYLIEVSTPAGRKNSPLNGYLVYCNKDYIGGDINWYKAEVYDYSFGEITFGNNIVSPYFTLLLTDEEFKASQAIEDFDKKFEAFFPYRNMDTTGKVIISDDDYHRCISILGYPFITEEELEYTREEICDLAIKPALEEYFHWLPPMFPTEYPTSTLDTTEITMPTDAYSVVGISLQQYGTGMNNTNLSPFQYAMEQALMSGYSYGGSSLYGSMNTARSFGMRNGNGLTASLQQKALSQALINYGRRVHYEGPYTRANGERYIKVYSNTVGTLNIWWAKKSLNFNDVEYSNRTRVFEYSQANIKELFAYLRRQSKTDLPGQVDYSSWLTEAKETKERITGEYKKMVKSSYAMRGSLG